jgi:hypothetical protein
VRTKPRHPHAPLLFVVHHKRARHFGAACAQPYAERFARASSRSVEMAPAVTIAEIVAKIGSAVTADWKR